MSRSVDNRRLVHLEFERSVKGDEQVEILLELSVQDDLGDPGRLRLENLLS
jgi:hypothetical protein